MGQVNISLQDGQLGATLATADGVAGLVVTGKPDTGGYVLGTPILVTSLAALTTAGITQSANPFAYRQVKEFFQEAGTGAKLYLMLVAATQTVSQICDNTNPDGAKALLDHAGGAIRILGVLSDDSLVTVASTASGLNDDVLTARDNMAAMGAAYFAEQRPFRCLIGGTSYQGAPGTLASLMSGTTNNRTAILIGDTDTSYSNTGACVGLVLGRLATIPVMRKLSRVRTGPMSNSTAWLGAAALAAVPGDDVVIADNGFITWTTYPNVSGYYLSGDDTCSATTDDYHFLARGRVIDKAQILAYSVFVQEVDDEVPVAADGTIDTGFAAWLQQQITGMISGTMVANNECSGVDCFIDPAQNILATNQLRVVLKIRPVGYSTDIEISLGFEA
jgi:Protein of unknown function (DUF2586)